MLDCLTENEEMSFKGDKTVFDFERERERENTFKMERLFVWVPQGHLCGFLLVCVIILAGTKLAKQQYMDVIITQLSSA